MIRMSEYQVLKVRLLWESIDKILHLKNSQVKGLSYIPNTNTLYLGKDNKLHLSFQTLFNINLYNDFGAVLPEIELQNGDDTFIIPHGYAVFDDNLEILSDRVQDLNVKINRIDYGSIKDNTNYYWRYVYPIKFSRWFLQIESLNYVDEEGACIGLQYQKVTIANNDMHVFLTERKDICYMVIQSGSKIDSEEMYKRVFAIITSIGLITGNIFGDYHFQIASDDRDFDSIKSMIYGTLDDTKYCSYRIVNNRWVDVYDMLGQYEYQRYAQKVFERNGFDSNKSYYDNKPLEAKVFNGLANLCYNNNDIAISASMLLEGSQLNMIYQPPFYHVALEAITSALMDDNQDKECSPLEKNEYKNIVRPVLLKALDNIKELSTDAKRIYSNRIRSNLNDRANKDKLGSVFEKYGYNLTEADKKAIEQRNYTFHGHLSNIKKEIVEQRWDMFAVALRLHKLCSILLLKAAGYTGEILNNEVIWGVKEACDRKDSPYINI